MSNITKGNLYGISSKGGYWKDNKFYPNPVSATDPLHILYGYPVSDVGGAEVITAGAKSSTTYEDDGHGVITARKTYYSSKPENIAQGSSMQGFSALKCLRSSVSQDGKIFTTTAEYIGLANGLTSSKVVWSGEFGVGADPIKTHPKFENLKNNSKYGWDEAKGEFTDPGGLYDLRGVKSYYTPSLVISGYFYTSDKSLALNLISKIGKITNSVNLPGDDFHIYSSLPFNGTSPSNYRYFIKGASAEQLAHLYKIKFEIIYAGGGWNSLLYDVA